MDEKNITNTADEISTDTIPADEVSTATDETSNTDESVTAQILDDNTIPADNTADDEATDSSPIYLPPDYLANGYYAVSNGGIEYLRSEFVGEYAEIMAKLLVDMKPSDFNALLKMLKRSKKSSLCFEARLTAAVELIPTAMVLVHRKKAPPLLVSFIKHNVDNIYDDDDWNAFYRHMEAIAAYMSVSAV